MRLTEPERDEIRKALRHWLPVSYEGGVPYICAAVEAILDDHMAEAWDDGWEYGGGVGDCPKSDNPYRNGDR